MTARAFGAICLAAYRPSAEQFRIQLDSIAAQSHRDWVCIIGIDGRDPSTLTLAREIVGSDRRFKVHEFKQNVGFYRNFERTIQLALDSPAQWIALADQDDYWYPNKLRTLLDAFGPGVALVSGQARVVDTSGHLLSTTTRKFKGRLELLLDNQVTGSLSTFTTDVAQMSIPFPEPTSASYHDHWIGLCGLTIGTISFVEDVVQDYVQHGANVLGEERGTRIAGRVGRLRDLPGGVGIIEFIARERWGWRVRMAQLLVERGRIAPPDRYIILIAQGQFSPTVIAGIVRAVLRRRVPPLRALALAVGCVAWPWITTRPQ